MKKLVLLSMLLSLGFLAFSQSKIEVEIGEKNMSKGPQMAINLFIPEAKLKDIEPVWKKYINNRSIGERIGNLASLVANIFKEEEKKVVRDKLKVEKIGDELFVRSIEQTDLTRHSMDVYTRIIETPEGCQLHTFFQFTDSVFISESNTDKEQIQNMKTYIREFGVVAYRIVVDDQIKEAKKEVSKQEGVLKDIESVIKREEKAIARNEVDIMEYEAGIVDVQSDIRRLDESIGIKKRALSEQRKDSPNYDADKAGLKELAKEKSKNFKKIKSLKSKIKSKQADIKSIKSKIFQNDLKLVRQRTVIDEKEQNVEQLIQKKEAIQ